MNLEDTIAQIQSQLREINELEEANLQEQAATAQRIEELERELEQQYQRQSQLDNQIIELYRQSEELKTKLAKLERIAILSQQVEALRAECQDNPELLDTLQLSLSNLLQEDRQDLAVQFIIDRQQEQSSTELIELTIKNIKAALPNADNIHQQLIDRHFEKYQIHKDNLVDGLNLIWCAIAFIAFGRDSYRQLSRKHHPDLRGSDNAMQLINAAWEISQDYLTGTT